MVWIWVDMLRPTVSCLVLVYLFDTSWMISMVVVIHPMRCDLAVVFMCWGFEQGDMRWGRLCPSRCVASA
jgi:hypothetical protein